MFVFVSILEMVSSPAVLTYVENYHQHKYINFRGFSSRYDGHCEVCHDWSYICCSRVCLHANIDDCCMLLSPVMTSLCFPMDIGNCCHLLSSAGTRM